MKLLYKILFLISFSFSFGQSSTCANAAAMCSGNQGPFNNTTGVPSFGSLGCLGSTPNPAWFYMQVGTSGSMDFQLSQIRTSNGAGIDVDFILWGPFNSLAGICDNLALYSPGYTGGNNVVDCSYSSDAVEDVNIPSAVSGQYYMLLVTNFSGQAGTYTLNQNGGTGALSCDVVCGVNLGPDRILCGAATSVNLTASFLQAPSLPGSPIYSWFLNGALQYTTPTNTTTVTQNGTWTVSVTRPGCSDVGTDDVVVNIIGAVPFNNTGPINATPGDCNPVIDLTSYQAGWVAPLNPASFVFVYYDNNANVITNPTAYTPTASTSIFVEINAGPCNVTEEIIVNVNCVPPTCAINLTSGSTNQVLCQGLPIENIVYTTSGSATGATVTGLPTGLTTNYAGTTFTISGTPTQTGTFNYTVTTVGCTVNASQVGTITVVAVPAVPTISSTVATCSADGTSTISNYDTGVTYVFTPAGPGVGAGGVISGMVFGTNYTVLAGNGTCSSNSSTSFSNAAQLTNPVVPSVGVTPPTCTSDGVATITNYNAAFTYIFTPVGPTAGAGGLISGMTVGTNYTVVASNGSCSSVASSSFSNALMLITPVVPAINSVTPTCVANGSSTIANYNAANTYTFTPAGPTVGAGGLISGMVVGTNYTVTSGNGTCTSVASASFSNAAQLSIPVVPTFSVAAPTCSSNGVATISNYDVSMTYVFMPAGPTVDSFGVISGMVVGTNYVVAANNGSCASADSASFSIAAMLAAPATPIINTVGPTCVVNGSSSVSNYNGSLTYIFTPAGPVVGVGGAITGMITGISYTLVSNDGSCNSLSSSSFTNAATLSIPVVPVVSVIASTCSSDGVATIDNYVGGLAYVFTPAGPTVNTSGVISGMIAGNNYVVAASNGSCASPDSASFSVAAMLASPATPNITSVTSTCFADGTSTIANYNGSLTYTFTPAGPVVGAGGAITGMITGTSYTLVSNDGTCTSAQSATFANAAQLSSPVAPSLFVSDPTICLGERAIFQISGAANAIVTYSINGGANQTVTLDSQGNGNVEVVGTNSSVVIELLNISNGNCSLTLSDVASVAVQLCTIPKGISPNGDGLNDSLELGFFDIQKLEIFNRYGTKVYSKSNYENEWIGQSDNGNELPDGTYYFVIDFTDLETKTGWIYINRERK